MRVKGHWQHIPFGVEALQQIAPQSILDLSIGAGRWGLAVRELCAVSQGVGVGALGQEGGGGIRVEGVETSAIALPEHVKLLYDHIHVGQCADVMAALATHYDVVIIDGLLNSIEKESGRAVLRNAVDKGAYVLVTCSLGDGYVERGDEAQTAVAEASNWHTSDFESFPVVRRCLLRDQAQRPLGSFVLSKDDPQDLRTVGFGADSGYEARGTGPAVNDAVDRALDRVAEQAFENSLIKGSMTYRLATGLRRQPVLRLVSRLLGRTTAGVSVVATGTHSGKSQGSEVWLLEAHLNAGEPALPWDFIVRKGEWQERHDATGPYGKCLISKRGALWVPGGANPEIVFLSHPWSGKVRVTCAGRTEEIDLYSERGGRVKVYPMRTPMAMPSPAPAINGAVHSLGQPDGLAGNHLGEHGAGRSRASVIGAELSAVPEGSASGSMSSAQEAFVAKVRAARATVVAVHCPRWLGVTHRS